MKDTSILKEYPPAYIDMSIICSNCGALLWAGAYEQGIIGKLKKKIKKNGWIYREGDGTLCKICANKKIKTPMEKLNPTDDKNVKKFLEAMGIKTITSDTKIKLETPTSPQIHLSITCLHCDKVLWEGMYENGIIGKIKKLIKKEHWIHHPIEGTLCRECAKQLE